MRRRILRVPRPAGQQAAADLDAEIELHLALRAAELEAEGLSPEEARAEALRRFGDLPAVRREMLQETTRRMRATRRREWASDMIRDIRYAARSLVRSPAFTALALVTLALGIGATTAIYSVVDAVLLEPLPVPEPERVAMVWEAHEGEEGSEHNLVSPANYRDWRERSETFSSLAAIFDLPVTLLADGEAREVVMQLADPALFRVLGVKPRLGRVFSPEEGRAPPGGATVVVLSHGFWMRHFGGDRDVLGREIDLVGGRVEVVGVMGPDLDFFAPDVDFWMPTDFAWGNRTDMGRFIRVVGRLAPGATMGAAEAEMAAISSSLAEGYPAFNAQWSARVVPLDEQVKGDVRPALLVVLAAVGVLLLVTVVNVANLLLVRAASRRTELAVRASLGAGRGRILRELLTESLLLSLTGGLLGAGLAWLATRALVVGMPESLRVPRLDQATVDLDVLGFAALVAILSGAIFGLAPAFHAFRSDLLGLLREGRGSGGGGRSVRRLRVAIVVGEVALSLMLLIGAGLLVRSFGKLRGADLGIQVEDVLTARVTLRGAGYREGEARATFVDRAVESLGALPQVRAAGAISWLPLTGAWTTTGYYLPDRPRPGPGELPGTEVQAVAGEVLDALGIPLLRGRTFTRADAAGGGRVALVNEAFAEANWPGGDPLGRRVVLPWGADELLLEVVGVVGDVRQREVAAEGRPGLFVPYRQLPEFASLNLVVRSPNGGALAPEVRARVQELDPDMAVADLTTMRNVVGEAVARPRLVSLLVASFAVLAALLAALGIYGVLAYAVSLRSHELSIRQALGARARDVAGLVIREALVLVGVGVTLGALASLAAVRVLSSQLYQISPRDPAVFVGMPVIVLVIGALAGAVPALRAARVSPSRSLREE